MLLYINDCLARSLRFYLSTLLEHTIYEAKGMGLHLLQVNHQLTHPNILGSDSQAAIRALCNQSMHLRQYILDAIYQAAECLHVKQDMLINRAECQQIMDTGGQWKGKKNELVDLQVHWVPGYCDLEPNECTDEGAKFLPTLLCKCLPLSISALQQSHSDRLKNRWR